MWTILKVPVTKKYLVNLVFNSHKFTDFETVFYVLAVKGVLDILKIYIKKYIYKKVTQIRTNSDKGLNLSRRNTTRISKSDLWSWSRNSWTCMIWRISAHIQKNKVIQINIKYSVYKWFFLVPENEQELRKLNIHKTILSKLSIVS